MTFVIAVSPAKVGGVVSTGVIAVRSDSVSYTHLTLPTILRV